MIRLLFVAGLFSSQTALAEDCGFPPADPPPVPEGTRTDRESMDAGVRAVREYSIQMNAYFDCLQLRRDEWFYNMDRDQQARWIEDFNEVVDHLTEIETEMNEQIRAFNNRPT
ncbi:MAG: hypothetical protein IID51_00155 [Proteobacteria bacterium]|nr:hypothetical protein [Pseudomonadota bacterium]